MREHRNRPLDELGPQALAIFLAALRRAGVGDVAPLAAELVRFDDDHERVDAFPSRCANARRCAPIPAYRRDRFGRELTA